MEKNSPLLPYQQYINANRQQAEVALSRAADLKARVRQGDTIDIACLSVPSGTIVRLASRSSLDLGLFRLQSPAVAVIPPGLVTVSDSAYQCNRISHLYAEDAISLVTLNDQGLLSSASRRQSLGPQIQRLLTHYYTRAERWPDHRAAQADTERLLEGIRAMLVSGRSVGRVFCPPPPLDRRVQRVMDWITSNTEWKFDMRELACLSHTSERNLYKLMGHGLGQTPYSYFRRIRLLAVRRSLLQEPLGRTLISRCAVDQGFNHLGRFSALYQHHFGELPRDTVQNRREIEWLATMSDATRDSAKCG